MSMYKLLYAGEVLEGQHPAIVRKRLATLLKLDEQRMDVLFSGKAVVVKKAADDALRARYTAAFEKAGARLRVQSVDTAPPAAPDAPVPPAAHTACEEAATAADSQRDVGLQALPVGADILAANERTEFVPAAIDTEHLKVQGAVFVVEEESVAAAAPNVDHLSLAEVGAVLGSESSEANLEQMMDVDFDVAEPGADMDTSERAPAPQAPDTSHIQLQEPTP